MRGFDLFSPDLKLFEHHFLEASAGTGKTFTIEKLVLRLLQEGISLDEILVVTFTRAATIELKERIMSQLSLNQLAECDDAKIWTMHSFCFQMLQQHAFDSGLSFGSEVIAQESLSKIIKDYIRTSDDLSTKQLSKVLRNDPDKLIKEIEDLIRCRSPIKFPDWEYKSEIEKLPQVDYSLLLEDLTTLAPYYSYLCNREKKVKPEVLLGLKNFIELLQNKYSDPVDLPILQFTEENRLKKAFSSQLHYPNFLPLLQEGLIPKLALFSDTKTIIKRIAEKSRLHVEKVIREEELLFFEDLLHRMAENVEDEGFANKVRSQFKAVLIDEFQDTDPLQWKIFSSLFLNKEFSGPLYLVGDPKQSIYRFRNADLYTYFDAKKEFGNKRCFSLDTNYRSTRRLVEQLNILFSVPFIFLPKTGEALEIPALKAISELSPIDDNKDPVHILYAKNEDELFSTIVSEIVRLNRENNIPLKECAILVNDRFQAKRFMQFCSLPIVTTKIRSLRESAALDTWYTLVQAAYNPRDSSLCSRVFLGPLFCYPQDQIPENRECFYRYHEIITKQGIVSLFHEVMRDCVLSSKDLYYDILQLVDMAATSKDDVLSFYQNLTLLDEDDELLRSRASPEEDAINLMTIHVSKGLEFSVVFPIGICAPFRNVDDAEEVSEKMRMLYVACTRAKRRLYLTHLEKDSPIRRLLQKNNVNFSNENCSIKPPIRHTPEYKPPELFPTLKREFYPACIHSFSSLVEVEYENEKEILENILPLGAETGTTIHKLFERLNFETAFKTSSLLPFVKKELSDSYLAPFAGEIAEMLYNGLHTPLPAPGENFSLSDVDPKKIIKEMQFLFPSTNPPGFLKGFIDLVFEHNGKFYFIDWKTNYAPNDLDELIHKHQYYKQAEIYREGLARYLNIFYGKDSESLMGGSFFFFLRHNKIYSFLT